MKILLLYNEEGFDQTDESLMTQYGFGALVMPRNIPMFLSYEGGANIGVPCLNFNTKDNEGSFFSRVFQNDSIFAFTTMPQNLLKHFDGEYFQNSGNNYRIKCETGSTPPGMQMYAQRFIKFTKYSTNDSEKHPATLTKTNNLGLFDYSEKKYFATYLTPQVLELKPSQAMLPFYTAFFNNRRKFPLALPAERESEPGNYFGTYNSENNNNIEKKELRKLLGNYIFQNEKPGSEKLFRSLWEMVDQPVFTDFLKEGAYFSFHTVSCTSGNTDAILEQERDGKSTICFHYQYNDSPDANILTKWRSELIKVNEEDYSEINKIKKSITEDIEYCIPGVNIRIIESKEKITDNWDMIKTGSFDSTATARTMTGWWTSIEELKNRLLNTEDINYDPLKKFIVEIILNPSEKQGDNPHDHDLALDLFTSHLCKFPFKIIKSSRSVKFNADGIKQYFEKEWKKKIADFIFSKPGTSLLPFDLSRENEQMVYSFSLTAAEIFSLRLSLPANECIKSKFSAILNGNNALNQNFIL